MKVKDLLDSEYNDETKNLIKLIKKYCPNNFKSLIEGKAVPLFRGDRSSEIKFVDSDLMFFTSNVRAEPRKSLTGNSFINSYIASHPSWSDVPNRSFSSSCTTDYKMASYFGNRPFLIIPFDNAKTFASISKDWNDKEIANRIELKEAGDLIASLLDKLTIISAHFPSDIADNPELQKILDTPLLHINTTYNMSKDEVTGVLKLIGNAYDFFAKNSNIKFKESIELRITRFLYDYRQIFKNENPIIFFKREFTPAKIHVELYSGYPNLSPHDTDEPEIWFEGQFIAFSTGRDDTATLVKSPILIDIAKKI